MLWKALGLGRHARINDEFAARMIGPDEYRQLSRRTRRVLTSEMMLLSDVVDRAWRRRCEPAAPEGAALVAAIVDAKRSALFLADGLSVLPHARHVTHACADLAIRTSGTHDGKTLDVALYKAVESF